MFYLDFNAGIDSPAASHIIDELRALECDVTVLGSYQAAILPA
jgi:prephenate dehydratase